MLRAVTEKQRLRPQVILLGFVSLLNDSSSEMIYPLLPAFLTLTLGASASFIGAVNPETGKIAVICFFVLSGFLITYLLLAEERQTGSIATGDFYARRILRIWPLYYVLVLKVTARAELPMRVFRFSVTYLMWLFAALLVDHYLPTSQMVTP